MRVLLRLTLQQMLGGKKIWILALFLALPVLLLGAVLLASGFSGGEGIEEEWAFGVMLFLLYPKSLCILSCLIYGATILAGEIEDKTLVYLFTRAEPRWRVLLGKYVATSAVLAVLCNVSMTICYLMAGAPVGLRLWLALAVSITCASFAFTAIFCLLGLLFPRRAIPVGLMYGVVIETFLSTIPAFINELTVSHYIQSIAYRILESDIAPLLAELGAGNDDVQEILETVSLFASSGGAATALVVIPAVALIASGIALHKKEWPLTEGV